MHSYRLCTKIKINRLLNLESNEIIESQNIKLFENLIMKDKEFNIPTNKEPREEASSRIAETHFILRISKIVERLRI